MPSIPGVNHLDAVRALEKAGFRIVRQGMHIVISNGLRIVMVRRHNPVNAFTMGGIARDAGLLLSSFVNCCNGRARITAHSNGTAGAARANLSGASAAR